MSVTRQLSLYIKLWTYLWTKVQALATDSGLDLLAPRSVERKWKRTSLMISVMILSVYFTVVLFCDKLDVIVNHFIGIYIECSRVFHKITEIGNNGKIGITHLTIWEQNKNKKIQQLNVIPVSIEPGTSGNCYLRQLRSLYFHALLVLTMT